METWHQTGPTGPRWGAPAGPLGEKAGKEEGHGHASPCPAVGGCAHRKPVTLSPSSPQEYSRFLLFLLISGGPLEPLTPYQGEAGKETTGAGGRGIYPPLCLGTPGIQGSRVCRPKLPLAGPKPCRRPCTYSRPPVTTSGHFPPAHLPHRDPPEMSLPFASLCWATFR